MLQGTYLCQVPILPPSGLSRHITSSWGPLQMPHVGSVTWVLPQYPVLSPTAPVALGLKFVFSPRLHAARQGHGVCCPVGDHWALEHLMSVEGRGKKERRSLWTQNAAHVFKPIPQVALQHESSYFSSIPTCSVASTPKAPFSPPFLST